ncbi:EutN/CcmL family microcompartment protein [Alkalicoccus daliensis]|uniref:Ethanolamine utilization protein EutN n=1 Tax=Alkalicoccus daliensis TaxID=745820 RepID=A0A1H0HCE9_9BACI|nr:EutN/CcmL family microcompartment protein [Alkalicoccus daliensis]SDO16879.1 ethanolamine utilization protein EutN [Alkalicoccus daliensis]
MNMLMGKVISNVVSTRKLDSLQGYTLLVIELMHQKQKEYRVAADIIGAGKGEYVLLSTGEQVKHGLHRDTPVDMLVVGIIDSKPIVES